MRSHSWLILILTCACALGLSIPAWAVGPTVSNVSGHQRADGSHIVDIYYDLADTDSTLLQVSVRVSSDGGNSYPITPSSIAGDVGPNVRPGTSRHIVWDCATDLPGAFGTTYRAAVTASDETASGSNWTMPLPGGRSIEMVYVPAGLFLMGGSGQPGDAGGSDVLPQHPVYLSGYWIGKHEVTRGQYNRFMLAGGYYHSEYWSAEGWAWKGSRNQPDAWLPLQTWATGCEGEYRTFVQTDNHPVVGVSYYEAEAFAKWAGCRLPSEAQWEKAARWDGHPRIWPWGDVWDVERCNNAANYTGDTLYPGAQTAPAGSYPLGVSPYGCHDMAGNLMEWCRDWYDAAYYQSWPPGGWIDPEGPGSGTQRVQRGGDWQAYGTPRCADRSYEGPGVSHRYAAYCNRWQVYGFRLAR
ncbi:MAG: formylglycine-generating enzyme family protein [Armatimonadetes bacterium]|nr:formylglycine-generating enzyme family protein [Armatimonadota bacterium]